MEFSPSRHEHQTARLGKTTARTRLAAAIAVALIASAVGLAGAAPTAAQSGQQSLTVDPPAVPAAGTYDFTLAPAGFTSTNTNLAICNTGDPNVEWHISALFQYCGGLGSSQDATSGPFAVEGIEVGEDGVTFLLWEPVQDGESAIATVNIAGTGSGVAQTSMVSFSGTVTAEGGVSTDGVVVSVGVSCWEDSCGSEALPDDGSQRPRPLDPAVFLAETGVDSSGSWSVSASGVEAQDVRYVLLAVWDTHGELATRFIGSETRWELWSWESLSGIDVELEAGGQASGLFADFAGGPPPPGDYALLSNEWPRAFYALDVDPQTGAFTSPVVAPGEYSLAHGNHGEGHLANNDAARVQITSGQTTDAGTVQIQQPGQITGTVTDSAGLSLSGVAVSGRISSDSPYWSMPYSPFSPNGSTSFWTNTGDDGTYTAQSLFPGEDWQIEIEIPITYEYTDIASGYQHSCAIRTDGTIACWGSNRFGQADQPDGQYTAIAAGDEHTCAIRTDQTIGCWGRHQADPPEGQYTAIAAGARHNHLCAIRTDQTIGCWFESALYESVGNFNQGQIDAPEGQYTAIAAGDRHSCAIRTDQTIACWGDDERGRIAAPDGQYTAIDAGVSHTCALGTEQTITCWGDALFGQANSPSGQYTAIAAGDRHSCAIRTDQTIACWGDDERGRIAAPDGQYTAIDAGVSHTCALGTEQTITCWGDGRTGQTRGPRQTYFTASAEGIALSSGGTAVCAVVWNETPGVTCTASQPETPDETEPEDEDAATQCFAVHKFGAQPVDVAKSADRQTVLAQLSWGFHESIGCYLTLDEAALAVLQAAPAPLGFPAADPGASQQCSEIHKFGAQPVDVAKSADRQTVLAQVRWGYHDSIGCYLALDPASTAALRAAHTP